MAELMTCDQAEGVLALGSLGALDRSDETAAARNHLAGCASCQQVAAGFAATVLMLPETLPTVRPPARLRRNLMTTVYAEATGAPVRRPSPLRRLWDALPSGPAFTLAGAAATVAAIALGTWGALRPGAPVPAPTSTVAYQLSGTTAEPTAVGTLQFDRSTNRGVILVRGLQSPDHRAVDARVYEIWLIPATGAPAPAGFLTLQPDGVTWAGVVTANVAAYKTVAATVEPQGGTRAPTGTEVLNGVIR